MRILLSAIIVTCTATATVAQRVTSLRDPTEEPRQASSADGLSTTDGPLGSTMTLAQQGNMPKRTRGANKVRVLPVRPKNEANPALKHRLWMPKHTLKPGSAQLHFSRALLLYQQASEEDRRTIGSGWDDASSSESEELNRIARSLSLVFEELHLLATSEDSEWDHRLRDLRGPDMYLYVLPDVQQSRELARAIDWHFHYQIAQGDIEGALGSLQDGFRLAAFVGQGETLIQKLVGIAIGGIMLANVEQVIQSEKGPNLYWGLATLPRPLINIRDSVEFELSSIHRVHPVLEEAETQDRDEAYWNTAWAKVANDFEALGGTDQHSKIAFALLGVSAVQPAKKRLIESGMDADWVKSIPPLRAVLLDASREIRRLADDLAKANYLPGQLGLEILEREETRFEKWIHENEFKSGGAAIAGLLFPAVRAARAAGIRQVYLVNRLMTIEAIRMHAATHNGQVPRALDDLSPVPALPNPYNGKAFRYSVVKNGDSSLVTLSAEVQHSADHLKEIKIRIGNGRVPAHD